MHRNLAILAASSLALLTLPLAAAIDISGGKTDGCVTGYYKPYRSDGTLGSTCRPLSTGATYAWTTASTVSQTPKCGDITQLEVCISAYQSDSFMDRQICGADPDLDDHGADRDCMGVNWRATGSAIDGASGTVRAMFPGHEGDRTCPIALGTPSCTAWGNTHMVWHGPDNTYQPFFGQVLVASQGDGFTQQCHSTYGRTDANLLGVPASIQSNEAKVCFRWTSAGHA